LLTHNNKIGHFISRECYSRPAQRAIVCFSRKSFRALKFAVVLHAMIHSHTCRRTDGHSPDVDGVPVVMVIGCHIKRGTASASPPSARASGVARPHPVSPTRTRIGCASRHGEGNTKNRGPIVQLQQLKADDTGYWLTPAPLSPASVPARRVAEERCGTEARRSLGPLPTTP
jgi:hypothetical protein